MPTPKPPAASLGWQHTSLSDLVYRRLRDQILWGVISPGSVLSVRTLPEQPSVSPMPVREALLRLSVDELVEVAPRSPTRVTSISLERVREICEMRNHLEPLAARLAVANLGPADVEHLRRCLKKMDLDASANRPQEWHRWNRSVLRLTAHPLTDGGLAGFMADWRKVPKAA
ncbi:MAG TPA: GntR family transcriptional regulator [Candidatus Methylomirabilis sp.]|nr:GntR family transcriptional regulator [Candidatus Methylomirabilis sp.]